MNLAMCMIALAVAGADDQKFGTPPPLSGVAPVAVAAVAPAQIKDADNPEPWPIDLATATHIAFDNSEDFRVIEFGVCGLNGYFGMHFDGPLTIARINADVPFARCKANAMALVRSVERSYWNLFQAQVALESTEQVVRTTQELLYSEQAKLTCRASAVDATETAQRLEQFSNELVACTADVKVLERSLRKVLGLPPADNRRIVATTKPIEEPISFDWDTCVEEMSREQPENIEQQAIGRLAELALEFARNQWIPLLEAPTLRQLTELGPILGSTDAAGLGWHVKALRPLLLRATDQIEEIDLGGKTNLDSTTWVTVLTLRAMGGRNPWFNTRQAQYILMRTRDRQRQVFKQTADSLSRCFVEVDETFQQFTVAKRLKAAAAHRLAVQRASFDEDRITLDRWLDAVDKNAQAIAAEARHQVAFNNSLAALSEARGTLLADRDITIAEGPKRVGPVVGKTTEPISIGLGGRLQRERAIAGATITVPWLSESSSGAGPFTPPRRVCLPFEGGLQIALRDPGTKIPRWAKCRRTEFIPFRLVSTLGYGFGDRTE